MTKDYRKIKDYRRKFERFYGIEIPDGYQIHHLDFNHENNDIMNLLMIPKELHEEYHQAVNLLPLHIDTRSAYSMNLMYGLGYEYDAIAEAQDRFEIVMQKILPHLKRQFDLYSKAAPKWKEQ